MKKMTNKSKFALAISGGGIRSATIGLGFFQSLVKNGLIDCIDTLSTVSGGGYIGSYFSLCVKNKVNLEKAFDNNGEYINYLRNNSNYLCPNGPKDYISLAINFVKNWILLLFIISTLLFPMFLLIRSSDLITSEIFIKNSISSLLFISLALLVTIIPPIIYLFFRNIFFFNIIPTLIFLITFVNNENYIIITGVIFLISLLLKVFFLSKQYDKEQIENKIDSYIRKTVLLSLVFLFLGSIDTFGLFVYNNKYDFTYFLLTYFLVIVSFYNKIISIVNKDTGNIKKFIIKIIGIISLISICSSISYLSFYIYYISADSLFYALVSSIIVFGIIGNAPYLINLSSLQKIFEDRITRTYFKPAFNKFYISNKISSSYDLKILDAPPDHIVNTTVNNTVLNNSQIESIHRKGSSYKINKNTEIDNTDAWIKNEITYGKSISISAAAASPGMGYKTSVLYSMTLFFLNIRLGYWVFKKKEYFQLYRCIIDECFSVYKGNDGNRLFLSDGGHFDNLGLYELIKQGHKNIIVLDNEHDPTYRFFSLAKIMRQARTDFGCEIIFIDKLDLFNRNNISSTYEKVSLNNNEIKLRKSSGYSDTRMAKADIKYKDGSVGKLLYIKPALLGNESIDIINYYKNNPDFPHENTSDQFFSEEQWESYRKIGFISGEETLLIAKKQI